MTRKEFIKICGILGISVPFYTSYISCAEQDETGNIDFSGKVLIIGAGVGGLSAGYLLNQLGVDFEILEASSNYGGRIKINADFVDFPIPLGAEWIHTDLGVFNEIVNDSSVDVNVNTINYDRQTDTYAHWENGRLNVTELVDSDIKFVNYSWYNFYQQYIAPSIQDRINYNRIVDAVNYSGEKIVVGTSDGTEYTADRIIISVPLKVLQSQMIGFTPALPADKLDAMKELIIWDGFKAFIEFSQKFYDTQIGFDINPETDGQKLYYDAAYGQNSSRPVCNW